MQCAIAVTISQSRTVGEVNVRSGEERRGRGRRRGEEGESTLSTGLSFSVSHSLFLPLPPYARVTGGGGEEDREEGLSTLARDLRMRMQTHTQTVARRAYVLYTFRLLLNPKAKKKHKKRRRRKTLLNGRERAHELRLFLFISRNCKIKSERVVKLTGRDRHDRLRNFSRQGRSLSSPLFFFFPTPESTRSLESLVCKT